MLLSEDPHEMISFFQQVRTAVNGDWEWYLTSMKVLMKDDEGNPLLTIAFAIPIEAESHVNNKINRLLEDHTFLRDHHERFYSLGRREKEILKLISAGKCNHEISTDLHISEKTVETHRKNIKRKLKIKSPFDLQQYARAFDLI